MLNLEIGLTSRLGRLNDIGTPGGQDSAWVYVIRVNCLLV